MTKERFDHIKVDSDRPVVFLDMCGVLSDTWLNTQDWAWDDNTRFNLRNPPLMGDATISAAQHLLVDIFKYFDVQVVLVSSWVRSYLPADDPEIIEFARFMDYPNILGSLSTPGGSERGAVIRQFISAKRLTHWVVIDDSKEQMYLDKTFFKAERFVKPKSRFGFWIEDAERLFTILNDKPTEHAVKLSNRRFNRLKNE